MTKKNKSAIQRRLIPTYIFLIIVSFFSVFPLYWMISAATNTSTDVSRGRIIPGSYFMENFKNLTSQQPLWRALGNSFLYAILTIVFMIILIGKNFDYGAMAKYHADLVGKKEETADGDEEIKIIGNGKVIDLILPIIVLIVLCISAMLYTGGILDGAGVATAFADCDSSLSLVLGSFFTLIFIFFFYLLRRIITFSQFCESFVQGFKAMTPAIMILSLAWTLSGICSADYLALGNFVGNVVSGNAVIGVLLPALFFAVAIGLSFSTGTSWGTFGIMIPIVTAVINTNNVSLLALNVAAVLAGAVCGDHISPISDTTILASAGAQCNHINHVSTQIPYAMTVAGCCLAGYLVGGFTGNGWLALIVGLVLELIVLAVLIKKCGKVNLE